MLSVDSVSSLQFFTPIFSGQYVYGTANPDAQLKIRFTGQPRGRMEIKNQTRGTSKVLKLHDVLNKSVVWDRNVDDPTGQTGDVFTIEYSGKATELTFYSSYYPDDSSVIWLRIDGSGDGSVSGITTQGGD